MLLLYTLKLVHAPSAEMVQAGSTYLRVVAVCLIDQVKHVNNSGDDGAVPEILCVHSRNKSRYFTLINFAIKYYKCYKDETNAIAVSQL